MSEKSPKIDPATVAIDTLGPARIENPISKCSPTHRDFQRFTEDTRGVVVDPFGNENLCEPKAHFEHAGPRRMIYFDASKVKAAVAVCDHNCPGTNSLVRALVLQLHYIYGVRRIIGAQFGARGLMDSGPPPIELTPATVEAVHGRGGCFLGLGEAPQDPGEMVDALERLDISVLFMIAGGAGLRAAHEAAAEIKRRGLRIAIICVPKTVTNAVGYTERSHGFATAVGAAARFILGAHNEATGAPGGIGLVKVMGQYNGFVACYTTLALSDVNYCLIPEVDFDLDGPDGLLAELERRIDARGHAVIVVADGAGAKHLREDGGDDIGQLLKTRINRHMGGLGVEVNLKYMDPSHIIRAMPANAGDRIFAGFLAHAAVHAAMAGKTDMMVALWGAHNVHVPLKLALSYRARVDPAGGLWRAVREGTGQPPLSNHI